MKTKQMSIIGIVVGVAVGTGIVYFMLLASMHQDRHMRRSACVNNLKQVGLVLGVYAMENEGQFPPVDNAKNNFIFEGKSIYPEYVPDANILACPEDPEFDMRRNFRLRSVNRHAGSKVGAAHPDCITDMSYCYLGWLVTNDEEAKAFFEAYDKLSPDNYDRDIIVADGKGNGGGNVIHRLRGFNDKSLREIAKIYSNESASPIPIMWDIPSRDLSKFSHILPLPPGGNVLFFDGHVEFIKYPGKFPMTETMARLLDERPRAPILDCEE